ncbi:MAG TPA: sigma-70 family RNA polymerase sigma factor [Gemmata sp.]|nr:sigma-70 family RNA polymerase sigma factor [Gemmata sp.]
MTRILELLREQLQTRETESDRHLLDRFITARDDAAFAELVRRHGRLVWGVCRRQLAKHHDAEDAFQTTFLVLIRRAARLRRDVPLGPWLHRVAVMTSRNLQRGNRRRAAVTVRMDHDVPAELACGIADRLDIDAALLALPEKYRVPVVLCHLQGLSRKAAASLLGCPEGTLSSLLNRALVRLRTRLGTAVAGLLAVAGTAGVPSGLYAATVRSGMIFSTSTLTAAGLSPSVVGLTSGVLRMFWMKKVIASLAMAVLVASGLLAGFAMRSEGVALATQPQAGEPQGKSNDPDAALKRLEKQIADVRKQKELLGAMEMDLFAEKEKIEQAKKSKAAADAAAELGDAIVIELTGGEPAFVIREVVNGKVAGVACTDLDILTTYLRRALKDPKGPRKLRVSAPKDRPLDQLNQVFAACGAAGYTKASFSYNDRRSVLSEVTLARPTGHLVLNEANVQIEPTLKPGEVDLTKYLPRRR